MDIPHRPGTAAHLKRYAGRDDRGTQPGGADRPGDHRQGALIKDQGNRAAHDAGKPLSAHDATACVRELFHVCYWFARTYAKVSRPDPALRFDVGKLEKSLTITASTVAQIQKVEGDIKAERKRVEEALRTSEEGRERLDLELVAVRSKIAALRKANSAVQDTHD